MRSVLIIFVVDVCVQSRSVQRPYYTTRTSNVDDLCIVDVTTFRWFSSQFKTTKMQMALQLNICPFCTLFWISSRDNSF